MRKQALQIRLGVGWSFFANGRPGMQMLGTVQDGMQIGALAQLAENQYAQVNGDIVRPLNTSKVEHALDRVTKTSRNAPLPKMPAPAPVATTVVIKKRRKVTLPER